MAFSRQEYCTGLPFPSPGDLRDPGIEPRSPTLQGDSLPSEPPVNATRLCFSSFAKLTFHEDNTHCPLGLQGDQSGQSERKSTLKIHCKFCAEAPILWPPDAKSQLTGKDSEAGED